MRIGMLCLFICLAGCSTAPKKTEGLKPVTGTIKFKGQPLTKGVISFVTTEHKALSASSPIEMDGKYTLRTDFNSPGARPGSYKIRIESWLTEPGMTNGKFVAGKEGIPDKYFSIEKSGLTATVTPGTEPQVIDFELKE